MLEGVRREYEVIRAVGEPVECRRTADKPQARSAARIVEERTAISRSAMPDRLIREVTIVEGRQVRV